MQDKDYKKIEQILADSFQCQHQKDLSDMSSDRIMEALGSHLPISRPKIQSSTGMLWRAAITTAAAAVIIAVAGLQSLPSDAKLAWELQHNGVVISWIMQSGE